MNGAEKRENSLIVNNPCFFLQLISNLFKQSQVVLVVIICKIHHSTAGAMVQQCNGATMHAVVQWCNSAVVQWRNSAMVQQCGGSTVQWCNGARVQQCSGATVQWCKSATVQWCNSARTVVQWCKWYIVTRKKCDISCNPVIQHNTVLALNNPATTQSTH